jgi:hypothetical protein
MLRLARRQTQQSLAHLLVSAREPTDLIYAGELVGDDATVLFTRAAHAGSVRVPGRITADDIRRVRGRDRLHLWLSTFRRDRQRTPPISFDGRAIRVERFGPTG